MTEEVSRSKLFLARLVVVLVVAFVVVGLAQHGFSTEVRARLWQNLLERPSGPMTFRFILQPVMAAIAALLDGVRDARTGRAPFLETVLTNPAKRVARLQEAVIATARIILLGLIIDTIYQFIEFETFHPAEAVIIALLLAFVPYVALRGIISRIARLWIGRQSAGAGR
jgi:tryptophan-rich sensory protein